MEGGTNCAFILTMQIHNFVRNSSKLYVMYDDDEDASQQEINVTSAA